jgi:hypothetical protein
VLTARAAVAGALVMMLGMWVATNPQVTIEQAVAGIGALLLVIALLVGVDIRHPGKREDKEDE